MNKSEIYTIWNQFKHKIILLIRSKVKINSDIDDIAQEVLIKFWINNAGIKDKSKILNWLYSVTRFTIADYYRKKEKQTVLISEELFLIDSPQNNSDESKKLLPIIYSLPNKYKNVLILSEILGIPHKEIANQFELTISCVKSRVIRGRKLLADKMKECCSFSYDKYGNIVHCEDRPAYFDCLKEKKS